MVACANFVCHSVCATMASQMRNHLSFVQRLTTGHNRRTLTTACADNQRYQGNQAAMLSNLR